MIIDMRRSVIETPRAIKKCIRQQNRPAGMMQESMHLTGQTQPIAPAQPPTPPAARRLLPVRILVTLVVTIPITVVALALIFIASATARGVAERLGDEIVTSAITRTSRNVQTYLDDAMRVSDLYERRIRDHRLPTASLGAIDNSWLRPMLEDLLVQPSVASICFGNPEGDSTWLLRHGKRMEFGTSDGANDGRAIEFVTHDDGTMDPKPIRVYKYDPRQRPWYAAALASPQPTWTPVYFWFGEQGSAAETGSGYTRAVRDETGKLLGVLVIDVTLGALSDYLQRLPLAESGFAYIVDDQDMLVAASHGSVNSSDGKRLRIDASDSPAARAVASLVIDHQVSPGAAAPDERVEIDGRIPARMRLESLSPYPGINWRLVLVLPESSFLTGVHTLQWRATVIALCAVLGALWFGLRLSLRLSDPLLQLMHHVNRVGHGDFDARLTLGQAREFDVLAQRVNQMAGGLKHRMQLQNSLAIATHVQKSLLPKEIPTLPGLDIAGQSRFCEGTGGDYYDFVDIKCLDATGNARDETVIAVGDVMGHGVGSALLMATARGALRASAAAGNLCLDTHMAHVNHVLACDVRHGMFMTMVLMAVDAKDRWLAWASAGHEPPLMFDPATKIFEDLVGSDIPLGIELDVNYHRYKRENLPSGAILVLGTDGIWEARNPEKQEFGKERLRDCIRANAHLPAAEIASALNRDLAEFTSTAPVRDDATFVIVKLLS